MPTKAQIDKLHARIDELEEAMSPGIDGCVVQLPHGWDEKRVWQQHCKTYPEDAKAKLVVFIALFGALDYPPGKEPPENSEAFRFDPDRRNSPRKDISKLEGNGWRGYDDESWRVLAKAERARGRDPNVTLREP